jgi:hypothetical protein
MNAIFAFLDHHPRLNVAFLLAVALVNAYWSGP